MSQHGSLVHKEAGNEPGPLGLYVKGRTVMSSALVNVKLYKDTSVTLVITC